MEFFMGIILGLMIGFVLGMFFMRDDTYVDEDRRTWEESND